MRFEAGLILIVSLCTAASGAVQQSVLQNASRGAQAGWFTVHLQGTPKEIGYQHGYLLAPEIEDAKRAIERVSTHELKNSWNELRELSRAVFWPHVPDEYRQEIAGIAAGLHDRGSHLDTWDLVVMNASMELSYYYDSARKHEARGVVPSIGEHCSAFVASGAYTKDGRIVIGHNNWSDYLTGSRWNVIFDVVPSNGHHFIMDGVPGLIHSGDDFGINDSGLMITETTISNFHGFKNDGIPEFVRARKAMQYAESIDDFVRIMKEGNNGGYANAWLIGDRKSNEIARLELGLKNVTLERSKDGYFVGSNFPVNPKLIAEETDFPKDPNTANQVRHRRWDQLMTENKGSIDVEAGKRFETDHYDALTKEIDPNERTICGHIDRSNRGLKPWQNEFGPAGAVEAKVADSAMSEKMSFVAGAGHPCGLAFHAAEFLKAHPEFRWQEGLLRNLDANPWTVVSAPQTTTSNSPGAMPTRAAR
jgi:hypothetical protein